MTDRRPDRALAALPPAAALRAPQPAAAVHRAEAALVPAAPEAARCSSTSTRTSEPEFDAWRWVGLLGAGARGHLLQARGVHPRAHRARAARLPARQAAAVPGVVGRGDQRASAAIPGRSRATDRAAPCSPPSSTATTASRPRSCARARRGRAVHCWLAALLVGLFALYVGVRARPLRRRLRPPGGRAAAHRAGGEDRAPAEGQPRDAHQARRARHLPRRAHARAGGSGARHGRAAGAGRAARRRSWPSTAAWWRRAPPASG